MYVLKMKKKMVSLGLDNKNYVSQVLNGNCNRRNVLHLFNLFKMELEFIGPFNMNKNILGDLRLNSKDTVELIKGFKVGSQRTVIIKVPVIAYPPPVTSRFTWADPEGQMINGTHVALL